jgi:hypothetical protein
MKNVSLRLLAFVVAAPALASCDPALNLIQVAPGCPDMPLRGPAEYQPASDEAVIDDFEDGDMRLAQLGGRDGTWVGFGTPGQATVFGEASDRCVAHGTHSGHLTGVQFMSYGGNWNGVLIDPFAQAVPFDARSYSGFSFWVATGADAVAPLEMPIGVMTRDTSGGAGICTSCGDYYGWKNGIPLTRTWTRWVVKFDEMRQSGRGQPQVLLRKDQLVSIMIWPMNTYDIWIDDVRFEP